MNTMPSQRSPDYVQALAGGVLQVFALGNSAFRVRFLPRAAVTLIMGPILTNEPAADVVKRSERDGVVRLSLETITCEIGKDGRLSFFDRNGRLLLRETKEGRRLTAAMLGIHRVCAVEQSFESPANEHLYGTGCFQDGALNVRGLPRRLTQVNSQISLPFLLSDRGYGFLWHNQGMSELNPPQRFAPLAKQASGSAQVENVTTT